MSDWKTVTLDEALKLQRGHDLPTPERVRGDVPVVGSFGVTGWHNEARYEGPGVAIGRSGASIGSATFVKEPYWPLNTCLFVRDFKGNDPRWVFRLLDLTDFVAYNSGSAQPSLNRNFLSGIPVQLPPLNEQRAIAEVLGALDDKIAANRNVIVGVADLIAAKFRAVEKRPGEATFAEMADVGGGGTPKTKVEEYWGGDVQWATPTDVTGLNGAWLHRTNRTISKSGLDTCSSSLYPEGSILMTSRATIGAFAIAARPMAVNQGFIVVNSKRPDSQWWLYAQMRARTSEFLSHANGATFLELSRGRFKALPVWEAHSDDVRKFCSEVDVLMAHSRAVESENETLAATRDGLLPLLMSGKLRVKDAEKQVGEVL